MEKGNTKYSLVILAIVVALVLVYSLVLNQPLTLGIAAIAVLGFLLAYMDTAIGMGFGTIGTPILLIIGYTSKMAVPSILVSQGIAAALGFLMHRKYKNVDVEKVTGTDAQIALRLIAFGVLGTILATLLALHIPKLYVNTYIGILVVAMGAILLLKLNMKFSWMKINAISFVSGFNKAISGGGYGPVATTGLVVSGHPLKNAIGVALLSVCVINFTAFGLYLLSNTITNYTLPIFLCVGSVLGSQIGPRMTKGMNRERSVQIVACLAIILGILTILTTYFKLY